ncbi:unnamed protein product [Rotaria magnacalcarata]|uniref:Uncharacterized protein n=1 Tax=Rotaria magnacalcarata TaxID=392030 RepID=A0A819LKZ3_9BILA|nr:unnamed protein product [Rotaria magnacalcarata]
MSRSTFLTKPSSIEANETQNHPTTANANIDRTSALRFHHRLMPTISTSGRSNETIPVVVVQSSSSSSLAPTTSADTTKTHFTQHKSVVRLNPKLKRNIRGTRRSTGIQPDEVALAEATNDSNFKDDDEEEDKSVTCNKFITITSNVPSEPFDSNRKSPPKPVFQVSRLQSTFDDNTRPLLEKLSISRKDPFMTASSSSSPAPSNSYPSPPTKIFRTEEFILRRQSSDDDPGSIKRRQIEERICKLESVNRDKDSIIHDLQRQLDKATRDLKDAEQQIYILQRDKLAMIKTLTTSQDTKSSQGGDLSASSKRTGIFSSDNLCRLIELNLPEGLLPFATNDIEEKLFYKTEYICQNKPIFRSIKYENLYQFQSPNNRWWTLYDTTNSTYKLGTYEWCNAWDVKPILAMSLGMFQHPLGKQVKLQRWKRIIIHKNNNSYAYKSISNTYLKCYYLPSTSACQTNQLTFLFDLTETTNTEEFNEMKLLTKTLLWILFNQTNIALSYYSDTFHMINSFDEKTSARSFEHLFDSIDAINKQLESSKQISVPWTETIHNIVTRIFKRRLLLPVKLVDEIDEFKSLVNDTSDEEIYTEPYPLYYNDEKAIKTVLNITDDLFRGKRSFKKFYDKSNHVLVILTSRSKYLYDYRQQDKQLGEFIAAVPLRIVVIDFNKISNEKFSENIHSAFIHYALNALASSPTAYNYIETYEEFGDVIHGTQLFNHYHRLCHPPEQNLFKDNFTANLIETNDRSSTDCSLLTLFNSEKKNSTLKEKFDYTFYETTDQCFSSPVYRSLGDRNLYVQRTAQGRWLIIRVDPLLPSTMSIQQKFASTTTSTLSQSLFIFNLNNCMTLTLPELTKHRSGAVLG